MGEARKPDPWTLLALAAMYALLLGNFALYWSAPLPTVVHVLLSAAAIHLSFTVWHEAVHRNAARSLWANNLIGVLGMFPYVTPYFMQKWVHLQHHARLNEREDPNVVYASGPFWRLPLRYPSALAYTRRLLERDPRQHWERVSDALSIAVVAALFAGALLAGVFWDVVLLWFVPLVLAKGVMDWYINWLPHVGLPAHRFRGTRVVDVPWLTPLVLQHNYHAVHHLWPTIPWHAYRAVFREKFDYLRSHGVPIEHRVFARRYRPGGFAEQPEIHHPR
jgi:ring-1,2-phenylacetyl-CoA epoxidase subunit PaaE